jgi:hypothetical protein
MLGAVEKVNNFGQFNNAMFMELKKLAPQH